MEYLALGTALRKLFPNTNFKTVALNEGLAGDPQFRSFTSKPPTRLLEPLPDVNSEIDEMIRYAAADAGQNNVDGVLILEDLELANVADPELIIRVVRAAVSKHLSGLPSAAKRVRTAQSLLEKVSFHLAAPMTEAWIFADPRGPENAGASHLAQVTSRPRYEAFRTDEVDYLNDEGAGCATWQALSGAKRTSNRPPWLKQNRGEHPKHYLQWLCRRPTEDNCTQYRETHQGAAALALLDWMEVLADGNDLPYLRSMISDLADLHGIPTPVAAGPEADLTSRSAVGLGRVLRNL